MYGLIAVGLILVVILALRMFVEQSKQSQELEDTQEVLERVYIPFDNSKDILISDFKIKLPEGWQIKGVYKVLDPDSPLTCQPINLTINLNDCEIYEVSNEANTFFLSRYPFLINTNSIIANPTKDEISFLALPSDLFKFEKEVVARENIDEGGESKSLGNKYISQSYVCSKNLCLSSGSFSLDLILANSQFGEFKAFASRL